MISAFSASHTNSTSFGPIHNRHGLVYMKEIRSKYGKISEILLNNKCFCLFLSLSFSEESVNPTRWFHKQIKIAHYRKSNWAGNLPG